MSTRRAHQLSILRDLDALHALAVASLALLASGGLLYLLYFAHVLRVARRSSTQPMRPGRPRTLLLFGKRCQDGEPDADFRARIERAGQWALTGHCRRILLLGGGPAPTEAEIAAGALRAAGLPEGIELILEHESRDTLQNLRHARGLLAAQGEPLPVLLSSRYHLARCALLARNLGIRHELCAAEDRLRLTSSVFGRLLSESLFMLWIDLGARWARLIGHRRMLAKVT